MELFEAKDHYIVQNGEHGLWCNRLDGSLTPKRGEDICTAWNPICLGKVHGVIGKMKIHPDSDWQLLLIRQQERVGTLPGGIHAYKITKICVLPISLFPTRDLDIELCEKHHFGISKSSHIAKTSDSQSRALQATWNSIKSAAENVKPKKLPFKIPQLADMIPAQLQQREVKERERLEKRILEELHKMFTDSDSFYYCKDGDITSSLQRLQLNARINHDNLPPWQRVDDRFFWNRHMLEDVIASQSELAWPWVVPIIQGYMQIETCTCRFSDSNSLVTAGPGSDELCSRHEVDYKLILVSRRSRFRAGTRYKRRGVDESGHCANYVETEQILEFRSHVVSFVQVRGSVPLYWSQTGIKYRPPPRIDKGIEENNEAFELHFAQELSLYGQVAAISLVDQTGKEKVIADTFLRHILTFNNPSLTYVAFDFHEYCRGMQFENVNILLENIEDVIKNIRYCWADKRGIICEQKGVLRVNCIDCLDRTNIVQSAIGRAVLETQCRKLGLLPPEEQLPAQARAVYQQMWANNGDTISRQYAGTAALKGDYTRTGERKFSGMMKDGVNSASRYYINRVKDVYRQATIDLMHGLLCREDLQQLVTPKGSDQTDSAEGESQEVLVEKEENLKTLIDECKKLLLPEQAVCLGGWGLIDCDASTGDPTRQDMDVILLLTREAYYVANYDDDADEVCSYQKIPLNNLYSMEIGPLSALFKSSHMSLRMSYLRDESNGFFHTFRTTNTRLFNNIVIYIKTEEEAKESMKAIYESFSAAKELLNQQLDIVEKKLDRKRSKPHLEVINIACQAQEQMDALASPHRNRKSTGSSSSSLLLPRRTRTSPASIIKAGAANISKTLTGLNPMRRKNRTSKGGDGFTPAVIYCKEVDSDSDYRGSVESLEAARILGEETIAAGDVCLPTKYAAKSRTEDVVVAEKDVCVVVGSASQPDLTSLEDFDLTLTAQDGEVILGAVGILSCSPIQLVAAVSKCENPERGYKDVKNKAKITGSHQEKDRSPALTGDQKSKSLDYMHCNRNMMCVNGSSEKISSPVIDFCIGMDSSDESSNLDKPSGGEQLKHMMLSLPSHEKQPTIMTDISPCDSVMSTPPTVKSKMAQLHHPCMKTSYSEGSIATNYLTDSYENISVDDIDDLDIGPLPSSSALSRLKTKVSNLAVSSMPSSPGAKRRAAERMAKQKKIKSQLRFQECKTRIILL